MIPPKLNSESPDRWNDDRSRAKEEIFVWLSDFAAEQGSRTELEKKVREDLFTLAQASTLKDGIRANPAVLCFLRALTRRNIGTAQTATYLGIKSSSTYERIESGHRPPSDEVLQSLLDLLEREIDHELAGWLFSGEQPKAAQVVRSAHVAADRILTRQFATRIRYGHEPRQLAMLEEYLINCGYSRDCEVRSGPLHLRDDLRKGTFAYRTNVAGQMPDGTELIQSVDVILAPYTSAERVLPILIEAKSMTDEVNPNKRQKEEAQKAASVRRRWASAGEPLCYLLLLGGTVPQRYLQIEAASDIDWIWEHRVEDLDILLDWYRTL